MPPPSPPSCFSASFLSSSFVFPNFTRAHHTHTPPHLEFCVPQLPRNRSPPPSIISLPFHPDAPNFLCSCFLVCVRAHLIKSYYTGIMSHRLYRNRINIINYGNTTGGDPTAWCYPYVAARAHAQCIVANFQQKSRDPHQASLYAYNKAAATFETCAFILPRSLLYGFDVRVQ